MLLVREEIGGAESYSMRSGCEQRFRRIRVHRPAAASLVVDHGNTATATFRAHPPIRSTRATTIRPVMATKETEQQLKHDPPFE